MSDHIEIGMILDNRYEILEKTGAGGMSVVYKAKCKLLNRNVAVKVLRSEYSSESEFIKKFTVEAQAAASLSHPNIVSVYDVGAVNDSHYIVMEYIEGVTLKEYIRKKGKLSSGEALKIIAQICSALECAHNNGIIHHDIKPQNIMLVDNKTVKVADFGIARASTSSTIVAGGSAAIGSVHYISPEQARGGYTDKKSDIYSCGVVLYEMLTGRVPFDAESPVGVAMLHMQGEALPPSYINQEVSSDLEKVVLKAMCREQAGRYDSASEMLSDVEHLLETEIGKAAGETDAAERKRRETVIGMGGKKKPNTKKGNNKKSKTSKGDKLIVAAAIGAAALVLMIVCYFLLTWSGFEGSGKNVEVPKLIEVNINEAKEMLADLDLELEITERVYTEDYEDDIIMSQDPGEGEKVKRNSIVKVTVSGGEEEKEGKEVPDVVGLSREDAKKLLDENGFRAEVSEVSVDGEEEDAVVRQSPKAEEKAEEGEIVTIYVNVAGDKRVKVPYVIGRSVERAKQAIEDAELKVGNITERPSSKEKGIVIEQIPDDGVSLSEGAEVDIVVSSGPEESPVPTSAPTEAPTPTPQANKVTTLSIPVPQDKDSTVIRVTANGTQIHEAVHHKSEGSFDLRVTGSSSAQLQVYHDGVLKYTKTVSF